MAPTPAKSGASTATPVRSPASGPAATASPFGSSPLTLTSRPSPSSAASRGPGADTETTTHGRRNVTGMLQFRGIWGDSSDSRYHGSQKCWGKLSGENGDRVDVATCD